MRDEHPAGRSAPSPSGIPPVVGDQPRRAPREPVRVETVLVSGDQPAFVLRGSHGPARMVFLHGMCGHSLGYVQSFQQAAAEHGTVIGLQGEVSCGPDFRAWQGDTRKLHDRITAAFRAAGVTGEGEITAIGYSQGATRAEALAATLPAVYTRVILLAAPTTPMVGRLRALKGAVLMAGEKDRQDLMRAGHRGLEVLKVKSLYLTMPGATHGSMGGKPGDSERIMGEALAFLYPSE